MDGQLKKDVETALEKLKNYVNGIYPWEGGTNRAALVGILQAALVVNKPNIDNIYPHLVSKLTKKSCKLMPNFVGKLRSSGLVSPGDSHKLQWEAELTISRDKLKALWDVVSKD